MLGGLDNQTNHFKQRPSAAGVMVPVSGRWSNLPQVTQLVRDTVRFWAQPSVSRVSTLKTNKHADLLLWFLILEGQRVSLVHSFTRLSLILAASWGTFHCGAWTLVVIHGFSCSVACFWFSNQRLNPCTLHWKADSSPGKSPRASTLSHSTASNRVHGPTVYGNGCSERKAHG